MHVDGKVEFCDARVRDLGADLRRGLREGEFSEHCTRWRV